MRFHLEASYGSLNKHGEELCGDKVEIVKNNSNLTMVLADGLGSGVKANILASLTSKIVVTMLTNGAEVTDVIDTMASTLPVCSVRQVAYSTFTFLKINKYGIAHIVEYDNPPIIILRNGKMLDLTKKESKIQGKKILESDIQLEEGDYCIFFSDGAIHAGVGKMLNFGWQHDNIVDYLEKAYDKTLSSFEVQQLLLEACNNLYMNSPGDDTTVAVCKVCKPMQAIIMTGPPINPDSDKIIVDELINFDGIKIACGGTTAQIISRVTKKELKTSIDYISPDVPPIAEIEGIDLVTEGVITLAKTYEYMKNYKEVRRKFSENKKLKKDGAFLLAETLMEKVTGAKFIVGRAVNPAHQNPNLPLSLNLKLKLVEQIIEILKNNKKECEVEYH